MKKIIFSLAFGLILQSNGVYFDSLDGVSEKIPLQFSMTNGGGLKPDPRIANGGGLKPDPTLSNGGGLKPDPRIVNGGGLKPDPQLANGGGLKPKPKRPNRIDDKSEHLYDQLFA